MKLFKKLDDNQYVPSEPVKKRKGILIVDDSRFSRNVLRDILINEGYEVVGEAKDGVEAVEMAKELRPVCIFLDVEMPKLDGLGALPQILSNDPNINVIMCTALGQKKIIMEATKAGAKDYVIKPYRKENIVGLLEVLHPRHDDKVIPFQSSGDIYSTEAQIKNERNKNVSPIKKPKYKPVSEYNMEDDGENVLGSYNQEQETLQTYKGVSLGEYSADEERLPIHKKSEDVKPIEEPDLSNNVDEEIDQLLSIELEEDIKKNEDIALEEAIANIAEEIESIVLEEEALNEQIEKTKNIALEEEEIEELLEETEDIALEEEVLEESAVETKDVALEEEEAIEKLLEETEDIALEEEVLEEPAVETEDVALEEEVLEEPIVEIEDIAIEEELLEEPTVETEDAALEEDMRPVLIEDEKVQDNNEYQNRFVYLWANRFDKSQGFSTTSMSKLDTNRTSFTYRSNNDSKHIEVLGQNKAQRWMKLGMMTAYMDSYANNKMSIGRSSPTIRNTFGSEKKRSLVENFIICPQNRQDITIAEIISNADIMSEVGYKTANHSKKCALSCAISELVISKYERKFSEVE